MKKLFLIPFLALGLLTSCSNSDDPSDDLIDDETPEEEVVESRGYAIPIELTAQQEQINAKLNAFSWRLFAEAYKLRKEGKNMLISPISLEMALGMLVNGLSGDDLTEMMNTMGLQDVSVQALNEYYQRMLEGIAEADDVAELHMANSFWYSNDRKVKPDFQAAMSMYAAETAGVNFALTSTVEAINAWCAKQTHDRIKSIMDDGVDPSIYAVLLNAVYFKSSWKDEFDASETRKAPFYFADGEQGEVDMMHKNDVKLDYLATDTYQAARLPFRNKAFSLFVVLPKEGVSIGQVAESLTPAEMSSFNSSTLDIFEMPKFEVEYTENQFASVMQNINPKLGFAGLRFQPLTPEIMSETMLEVLQKTFFKVDEKGAEAAAVTGIFAKATSAGPLHMLILDRPFIYGIMETSTACPLFIGYYGEK